MAQNNNEYRPQIPFPLGFDMGKPVPVPKEFEGGVERQSYTKVGENRETKALKPLNTGFKKEQ